jgi:hypothetical protein
MQAVERATFEVFRDPSLKLLREIYTLSMENCFLSPGALQAVFSEGTTLLALIVNRAGRMIAFGVARESGRCFARRLVIPTLPYFIENSEEVVDCFWSGLKEYCEKRWILYLDLMAFNSSPIEVPDLSLHANFTARREFILDLAEVLKEDKKKLSSNHRRNIRKAEEAGLSFEIKNSFEACKDHALMLTHSMRRHSVRYDTSPEEWFAYIRQGVGFIIQAMLDHTCLSSVLILKTSHQAYYLTGGTSSEGMKVGASHFLMWKVIQYLADAGVSTLNLGGVTENDTPALERFKAGFGAKSVELPHRSFIFGGRWRDKTINTIRLLRYSPRDFLHQFVKKSFIGRGSTSTLNNSGIMR